MRTMACGLILCAMVCAESRDSKQVTWTGWFGDASCAPGRLTAPVLTQSNPECVKTCLEKGVAPVFISEQARAIFAVKNYSAIIENLGYRLEISGSVDEAAKTISIQSVKRISEYEGAACARPKKKP